MKIIMLKGLSGSGKSTWANEQAKTGNYFVISKDEIRKMFGGYKPKREKDVISVRNKLVEIGISLKKNVIVDDTNLNPKHEICLRQIAKKIDVKFEVNDSFLKETPESCIERDLHRGDKAVGASVIWDQYYRWIVPNPLRKLNKEFDKPRCVLFDVDGTLAHNLGGRDIYDLTRVKEDTVDPFVGLIADALYNYGVEANGDKYPKIIIVSGREESARQATEEWLEQNAIPFDALYMRQAGDRRGDDIIKEEIYHEFIEPYYAVLGVFDDRPRVCRIWRKLGLKVAEVGNPYIEF